MRKTIIMAGLLAAALTAQSPSQEPSRADDEKAIRLTADAFTKAYNNADAKAVAALFIAGGEIVNDQGKSIQSREGIEHEFSAIFQARQNARIAVSLKSIRFLSQSLAIEDGTSTVSDQAGRPLEQNRYTVVHVKQDGRWRMASARDLPDEAAAADEELKQLGWLIGDWVDESPAALIVTSYHWADDRRAIESAFTIHIAGRPIMRGTQRIGWNPQAKRLHSWVFDSEGGIAEGAWTRDGDRWLVKMTGVTRDGKAASSTNITTRVAKDRLTWQSRDRVVGDELLENIEEITIVRRLSKPKAPINGVGRNATGEAK